MGKISASLFIFVIVAIRPYLQNLYFAKRSSLNGIRLILNKITNDNHKIIYFKQIETFSSALRRVQSILSPSFRDCFLCNTWYIHDRRGGGAPVLPKDGLDGRPSLWSEGPFGTRFCDRKSAK